MDFKLNKSNLNFRVYTASTLPSTAQENDICVISDVPMKNWILSPDAPSGAPRTDGDVWIQYSVAGTTVNVLKTGAMMVATTAAWQYVNGAWTDKPVHAHRSGEWVPLRLYIYKSGEQSSAITGGWKLYFEATSSSTPTATYKSDHLLISKPATSRGVVGTTNKVNFGGKKTLYLDNKKTGNGKITLALYSQTPTDSISSVRYVDVPTNSTRNTISLDISSLNGSPVYVGFKTNSPNEVANLYVYNIWAE